MTHDEVVELLGAFALDATGPEERAQVEAHLAECPRCRSEVDAHREMAAVLAGQGSEAPPGLWDKIAYAIADGAAGAAETGPDPVLPGRPAALSAAHRRSRWLPGLALAAVAAAVLAFLGTEEASLHNQVEDLRRQVSEQALSSWVKEPHYTVTMVNTSHVRVVQVYLDHQGQAVMYAPSLPNLPSTRTYQMWGLSHGQAVSLGLVGRGAGALATFSVGPSTTKIMVTAEPEGGTTEPTTPVLALGTVPAGYVR